MNPDKQRALLLKLERNLRLNIFSIKKTFTYAQAKKLWKNKKISKKDQEQHYNDVLQALIKHYKRVIPVFYVQIEDILKKSEVISLEKKNQIFEDMLIYWIEHRAFKSARSISKTTVKDITLLALNAFKDEQILDEEGFIKEILTSLGISLFRANTIARTETHAASMYASKQSAIDTENRLKIKLYKKWNSTKDERTRFNHFEADGQKVLLDKKFIVGGEKLDRPADPEGSPGNIINCRCVMTYQRKKT